MRSSYSSVFGRLFVDRLRQASTFLHGSDIERDVEGRLDQRACFFSTQSRGAETPAKARTPGGASTCPWTLVRRLLKKIGSKPDTTLRAPRDQSLLIFRQSSALDFCPATGVMSIPLLKSPVEECTFLEMKEISSIKSNRIFKLSLVASILMAVAWFGQYSSISYLMVVAVVFILVIACLIKELARRSSGGGGAANFVFLVVIVLWMGFISANRDYGVVDYVLIGIDAHPFDDCGRDGIVFKDGSRFSVCKTEDVWWNFGFIRSIVYDSSGQIAWDDRNPTQEWKNAATAFGEGRNIPKGRGWLYGSYPYNVTRIYGNYYRVDFYNPGSNIG